MNSSKQRKTRPKPARSARVIIRAEGAAPAAIELAVGKLELGYMITAIAADFGRAWRVEKLADGTVYHVNLDGTHRMCDCRGFLHTGHCKHADGIAALFAAGKL
jgi:hypothetical protein